MQKQEQKTGVRKRRGLQESLVEDASIRASDSRRGHAPEESDEASPSHSSSLFLLRLWKDKGARGESVLAGRLIHVTSGRASDFLDLATLNSLLAEMFGNSLDGGARDQDGPTR